MKLDFAIYQLQSHANMKAWLKIDYQKINLKIRCYWCISVPAFNDFDLIVC